MSRGWFATTVVLFIAVCAATSRADSRPPEQSAAVNPQDDGGDPLAGPRPRPEGPPPGMDDDQGDRPRRRFRDGGFRDRDGDFRDRRGEGDEGDRPMRDRRRFREGGEPGEPENGFGEGRQRPDRAQMIERLMGVLKEKLPDMHDRLQHLRQDNPEQFRRVIRNLFPVIREYMRLSETNPELANTIIEEFKIDNQLRELSRQYRQAVTDNKTDEQTALGAQIEELANKQFEIQTQRHQARLQEFEKRLAEQQQRLQEGHAKLQERMSKRSELISQKIEEIKKGEFHRGPGDDGRKFRRGRGREGNFQRGPDGERRRGPEGEFRHGRGPDQEFGGGPEGEFGDGPGDGQPHEPGFNPDDQGRPRQEKDGRIRRPNRRPPPPSDMEEEEEEMEPGE